MMDDKSLQNDIEIAEDLDEHLQKESIDIEDISGSLEAITQAITADPELVQLTDHQQSLVDGFKDASKNTNKAVYAVADSDALEGFLDVTSAVVRKAAIVFGNKIPDYFKVTAKGLSHYSSLAQQLRERLLQLRPLLEKRDFPFVDVFDYGAYSRFFQTNSKSISSFSEFQSAMEIQNAATLHVMSTSNSYGIVVMQKLLQNLQDLQSLKKPDSVRMIDLRDSIEQYWTQTWQSAGITPDHGQTPQKVLNDFPERTFVSLAPLLDNRFLVAHKPKNNGGTDIAKISTAIKHYGASVVFDKSKETIIQHSMNIPNVDDLLKMVVQTINVLNDLKGLDYLAKQNDTFAKNFKKTADILNKQLAATASADPQFYGFVAEYFKIATAVGQAIQQPYIQIAWLYVRCAMVVISLVELAVLEEPNKRIVTSKFTTKQSTEFSNPAMESFLYTQKALEAIKRVKVS